MSRASSMLEGAFLSPKEYETEYGSKCSRGKSIPGMHLAKLWAPSVRLGADR